MKPKIDLHLIAAYWMAISDGHYHYVPLSVVRGQLKTVKERIAETTEAYQYFKRKGIPVP